MPEITEDTVMSKFISEERYQQLISEDGTNYVSGCVARAQDVAPFCKSPEEAYKNCRLDYNGTPFRECVDNDKPIYVMRFTSEKCESAGIPTGYEPPCTNTGFVGSKDHLIPETVYKSKTEITSGAIYCIDSKGRETMVAYYDAKKHKFVKVKGVKSE